MNHNPRDIPTNISIKLFGRYIVVFEKKNIKLKF